jgi:hypothetical protein
VSTCSGSIPGLFHSPTLALGIDSRLQIPDSKSGPSRLSSGVLIGVTQLYSFRTVSGVDWPCRASAISPIFRRDGSFLCTNTN